MLLSFVSRGFTKSWVGQVASRSPINRHVLAKATRNEFLYRVHGALLLICAFLDKILALRVPRYRLAPVDCFFSSSITGKAPC